jgi:hypothetical protein
LYPEGGTCSRFDAVPSLDILFDDKRSGLTGSTRGSSISIDLNVSDIESLGGRELMVTDGTRSTERFTTLPEIGKLPSEPAFDPCSMVQFVESPGDVADI